MGANGMDWDNTRQKPPRMDDIDGTGEGECGNWIWVIGIPVDGGGKDVVGGVEEAGTGGWNGGTEKNSELTGAGGGSAGIPP